MGFRFRRSVRIAPGIRLNFSNGGVSTSIGGRGATLNLSKRGTRATVGIPGSGISYSTPINGGAPSPAGAGRNASSAQGCAVVGIIGFLVLAIATFSSRPPSAPTPAESVAGNDTAAASIPAYVAARAVNCRAEASTSGARVSQLGRGALVAVVDHSGGWAKLQRVEGDCWVSTKLLADEMPTGQAGDATSAPLYAAGVGAMAGGAYSANSSRHRPSTRRSRGGARRQGAHSGGGCPCSGGSVCIGPRGGRYCITSGGNKRYGV